MGSYFVTRFRNISYMAILASALPVAGAVAQPAFDDTPGGSGEWGFRPIEGEQVAMSPPAFVWRPQEDARRYQLQVAADADFRDIAYETRTLRYTAHTPPSVLDAGGWHWRVRFQDESGDWSAWSETRWFEVPEEAMPYPLPERDELLARLPDEHPRLFLRPEDVPQWRQMAEDELSDNYDTLISRAERAVDDPMEVEEPPMLPDDVERHSEEWRAHWFDGPRHHGSRVAARASSLAFAWLIAEDERYAEEARRLLLELSDWDPEGVSSRRNSGGPALNFAFECARAYTFLHDYLSSSDRQRVRQMMRVRGNELYEILNEVPHLWDPYGSHRNRMWHFLGEVAIAFHDEIPEARDWLWYAMNVFYAVYPVWSDSDGGWHEGLAYYNSYLNRFTWWADIMDAALDINAYEKPFFSRVGYFPMYMMPPGTVAGGFGDQAQNVGSQRVASLVYTFGMQMQNPHWVWYADVQGEAENDSHRPYAWSRAAHGVTPPEPPHELDPDMHFRGIGQVAINSNLFDADDNFQIIFKSAPDPFGSTSHGYESQNAFLMRLFGERLFIRSGVRDGHGSPHHRQWMHHTKSTNNVTVDGESQIKHTDEHFGQITAFRSSDEIAYVEGEAADAWAENVQSHRRSMVMIKPRFALVFDRLRTESPSSYQWHLHTLAPMEDIAPGRVRAEINDAAALVDFAYPRSLDLEHEQGTDPPSERDADHHSRVIASTSGRTDEISFVTLFWPHEASETIDPAYELHETEAGFELELELEDRRAVVELIAALPDERDIEAQPHDVIVTVYDAAGDEISRFESGDARIE